MSYARPARLVKPRLPWPEIITFTLAITLAVAFGTCIGVTGAFWIDRQLYPMEITD
jgi:hypothetical protein